MYWRILLVIAGAALATQSLVFGNFISPAYLGSVPDTWILHGKALEVAFFAAGSISVASTVATAIFVIDKVARLFAAEAKYVSRANIFWQALVLNGTAFGIGLWFAPLASGWNLSVWFTAYPVSLLSWFVIAPTVVTLVNVCREVGDATGRYEKERGVDPLSASVVHLLRSQGWTQENGEWKAPPEESYAKLNKLARGSDELQAQMKQVVEILKAIFQDVGWTLKEGGKWEKPPLTVKDRLVEVMYAIGMTHQSSIGWTKPDYTLAAKVDHLSTQLAALQKLGSVEELEKTISQRVGELSTQVSKIETEVGKIAAVLTKQSGDKLAIIAGEKAA